MNVPRYAVSAAKLLRRQLSTSSPSSSDPARGLATIERALRARAQRRAARVAVVGGLAVAAAAALVLATRSFFPAARPSGELVRIDASPSAAGAVIHGSKPASPLASSTPLGAGQGLETPPGGGASLRLSTGTVMSLDENSAFGVAADGSTERFTLQRGRLSAHVAKLSSGQRFIVTTPDAELEVRGTSFRARVLEAAEGCDASRTRLDVTEGVVEVRARGVSTFVAAGGVWPVACAESSASRARANLEPLPVAPSSGMERTSPAPSSRRVGSDREPGASHAERSSALTEQNDLFAQAVGLRRTGDRAGALRAYQELIARFPSSPLAENAMVERMRLLAGAKDPQASIEARRYLTRYPRGFAVTEAQQLIGAQ
jgi:hypothetical protein